MLKKIKVTMLKVKRNCYAKANDYCADKVETSLKDGDFNAADRWRDRKIKYLMKEAETTVKLMDIAL